MDTPDATSRRPILIKGAAVVTMDPALGDMPDADILVTDRVIAAIGPGIRYGDAEIVDASGMIAIPGFVDGHRHLWEGVIRGELPDATLGEYLAVVNGAFAGAYSPEDAYVGTLVSALGALDAGITTVLDWAHVQNSPEHTVACLEALGAAGIRALFAYGPSSPQSTDARYPQDLLRIASESFTSKDQLLTLALATLSPEHQPYADATAHFDLAREADAMVTLHAGLRGVGVPEQILKLAHDGYLSPRVNLVHCNALSDAEWRAIAETGASVSITPSTEMQMGQGIPPIQQALEVGVLPSLGVDVETSAAGDMWTQMRLAFACQRMLAFESGSPGEPAVDLVSSEQVLGLATRGGAKATGLESRIGTLSVGKQADIVLLRQDTINTVPVSDRRAAIVHNMDVRNVDTVMVGGRLVKKDGKLLEHDLVRLVERAYESQERVCHVAGRSTSVRHSS